MFWSFKFIDSLFLVLMALTVDKRSSVKNWMRLQEMSKPRGRLRCLSIRLHVSAFPSKLYNVIFIYLTITFHYQRIVLTIFMKKIK